jgi:hypothetical protein
MLVRYDSRLFLAASWASPSRERLAVMLSGYNGGFGHVMKERAVCMEHQDCLGSLYFGNIERYCGARGRAAWACEENRHYPAVILDRWAPLYRRWLQR